VARYGRPKISLARSAGRTYAVAIVYTGGSETRTSQDVYEENGKRKTNLAVDMPWGDVLVAKIIQHDLYLDCIPVETFVHFGGLNKVADIGHPVRLRVLEEDGDATMLHAYTTEVNLAHVALCRGRRVDCKQIFAEDSLVQSIAQETEKRKGRTNFHRKRVPAVDLPPWATHVLDPQSGLALDSDIAIHSDFQVYSAGRDVQNLRFEGSWARAMPRAGSVSARTSSVNEIFSERRNYMRTRNVTPGLYISSACCLSLSVRAREGSARRRTSTMI
jgi:hypothetical protein